MKSDLHPTFHITTYTCNSCKNSFSAGSTAEGNISVEVCSNCHPFYTGKAGIIVDTYSRVDRFQKQQTKADGSLVIKKRQKRTARLTKVNEVKAEPRLTLKDMLKQAKKS